MLDLRKKQKPNSRRTGKMPGTQIMAEGKIIKPHGGF
jgi:hypothetical protein